MKGFNEDELVDFVAFACRRSLNVRFIEYMPFLGNGWNEVKLMPFSAMRETIAGHYRLLPCEGVRRRGFGRDGRVHHDDERAFLRGLQQAAHQRGRQASQLPLCD